MKTAHKMRMMWELVMISGAISAIVNTFNTSLLLLTFVITASVLVLLTKQKVQNYILNHLIEFTSLFFKQTADFETTESRTVKTVKYIQGNQTFKVFLPYSRAIKSVKITAVKNEKEESFYIPQGITIKDFTPHMLGFDKITIHLLEGELTFEKQDPISY